jgi:hypothetical protein
MKEQENDISLDPNMSEHLPIDIEVLTDLMRNPVVIKIVTILDLVSLSFRLGLVLLSAPVKLFLHLLLAFK